MKSFLKVIWGTFTIMVLAACNTKHEQVKGLSDPSSSFDDAIQNSMSISNQPLKNNHSKNKSTALVEISNKWQLVWQDEFNEADINLSKWSFEVNCYGGGNDEKQCYTDSAKNAFIEQGILKIVALKEEYTGPIRHDDDLNYSLSNTRTLPYTSARLRSKNKGDWRYGRFEIRAKLPQGQGTWPAIWMLPTKSTYGGWASSGEIDIMEAVNLKTPSDESGAKENEKERRVHGTLHYGRAWPDNVYSGKAFHLPNKVNPADDFHEYAVEWQAGEIRWYVDDIHFATQKASGWYSQYMNENGSLVNGEGSAPFDQAFHMILNLAVGGSWSSTVNDKGIDESIFPQSFEIDYVRVYQCSVDSKLGSGCEAIGDDSVLVEGHKVPEL